MSMVMESPTKVKQRYKTRKNRVPSLGERMRRDYEDRFQIMLPRRSYTIVRVDGKNFKAYTKNDIKPFDQSLQACMDNVAKSLCEELQGAEFAYTHSDKVSVLLADFASTKTSAYFDGNLQKIVSVAASIATASFAEYMAQLGTDLARTEEGISKFGLFDAKVFQIPDPVEVENYFIWQQDDNIINSLTGAAREAFGEEAIRGKSNREILCMLEDNGYNEESYPAAYRLGRFVAKAFHAKGSNKLIDTYGGLFEVAGNTESARKKWLVADAVYLEKERYFIQAMVPRHGY